MAPPEPAKSYSIPVSYTHLDVYKRQGYDNIIPESCLCQVDIENTLDSAGIKYIEDCGDYIIIK